LVLVCSERRVLPLVAGGWFIVREKYCWLVADNPSEQGGDEVLGIYAKGSKG
jgi:hypothetical protein